MEARIVTPDGADSGIPGNNVRLGTDDDVKRLLGGSQRRTLMPPPGIFLQEIKHPVSGADSWAAIILPSEYFAGGWLFFDAAVIEGDIRFGRSERALLIKRKGGLTGTFILHRQAWIFGVDQLDDQTQELRKMKNGALMDIVRNAGFQPKEYKSAIRGLVKAGDKAFHNMVFWDNQIASSFERKKWEIGVNIEQVGEELSPKGEVVHRTEEVI